jgi:hypothetical protein
VSYMLITTFPKERESANATEGSLVRDEVRRSF